MAKLTNDTKVITNKIRLSYANIWEPKAIMDSGDPKYSASIIIDKEDTETIELIEQAVLAAKEQGKAKFGGKIPANLKLPLRDGDEERPDDEVYAGKLFLNASSKTKPGIIDLNRAEIEDELEVYSGCYARVSLNFYAFSVSGNKGIAVGLNNIQKVADGEVLAGKASAKDDFDDDFIGEDDPFTSEDSDFLS